MLRLKACSRTTILFYINYRLSFWGNHNSPKLDLCESLIEVSNDVVDMLNTDREADSRRSDVLLCKLLWSHLRVSGGVRVYHERLHVSHIGEERENLQIVNERPCLFLTALDFEREDRTCSVREVLLVESVVRMVWE